MLIDCILDRKAGEPYSTKELLDYLSGWSGGLYQAAAEALAAGDEDAVKRVLCDYVQQEYSGADGLCAYINSVDWVGVGELPVQESEAGSIRGWLATDEDGDCCLYIGDKPELCGGCFVSGDIAFVGLPAGSFLGLRPAPMAEPVEVVVDVRLLR